MKKLLKIMLTALLGVSLVACSNTTSDDTSDTSSSDSEAISLVDVSVDAGTLTGYLDDGVYTFKGVPYATAERFQNPVAVTEYENGTYMALTYGEVSPQDRGLDGTGEVNDHEFMTPSNGTADMVANEDCQYLNVWSNSLDGSKPVIVFFHGGGLSNGASSELSYYTGEYIAESEDVVFVSVNHRLNVLGYLDLSEYGDDYADSGNVGMEDCVEALKWIQNNISQFGGDPDNVTIVGQSGGGQKVTTLASMSDTVGLFDKVVVMSGSSSTSTQADGQANTQLLVDYLDLDEDEVISTLTSMSYEDLYNAATAAGCSWSTCVGCGTFESAFINYETGEMNEYAKQRTYIWGNAFSEFQSNGETILTGGEASLDIEESEVLEQLTEKYGDSAQAILDAFKEAYPDKKVAEVLYINTMPAGLSRSAAIADGGILDLMNDNGVTVYTYVSAYSMPYFGGITMHHTGDVPFMFNSIDTAEYLIKGDETNAHKVASTMSSALASFATDGNPTTDDLSWDAYTDDSHSTMIFDTTSECKVDVDSELYDLIVSVTNQ
ncbi:MAG: carboxylesterase family protein [Erysipelotrichaceae bacterium]|nr:carboxylesterase family protein [Erysipelotrichaceae bacterium]